MLRKTIIATALFLSFAVHLAPCQSMRPQVQQVVDSIATSMIFHFPKINIGGDESPLWQQFEVLQEIATDDELFALTRHVSKVVRCYAFTGLTKRGDERIFQFLLDNLEDDRAVATKSFDVIRANFLNDFYLYAVPDSLLTADQQYTLDSTILFNGLVRGSYKSQLLKDLPNEDRYYSLVRKYAEEGNGEALVTLARYRRDEDKELIFFWLKELDRPYFAFKAMREFPNEDFLRILPWQFRKRWYQFHYDFSAIRMIYQALAQYPESKKTLRVFRKTTKAWSKWKRDTFSQMVKLAILKYPHPNFEEILSKIKLSDFEERALQRMLERDL